jgi:hypothetical protein
MALPKPLHRPGDGLELCHVTSRLNQRKNVRTGRFTGTNVRALEEIYTLKVGVSTCSGNRPIQRQHQPAAQHNKARFPPQTRSIGNSHLLGQKHPSPSAVRPPGLHCPGLRPSGLHPSADGPDELKGGDVPVQDKEGVLERRLHQSCRSEPVFLPRQIRWLQPALRHLGSGRWRSVDPWHSQTARKPSARARRCAG